MESNPVAEEKIKLGLPILKSEKLEKTCHVLIKHEGGYFGKKRYILSRAKAGVEEIDDQALAADIAKQIEPSDQAIICQYWARGGKENFNWAFFFLLDQQGIRKVIRASWGWKGYRPKRAQFSKENYNDSAFRRSQQTVGEGKNMKFVYKGCKTTFVRQANEKQISGTD